MKDGGEKSFHLVGSSLQDDYIFHHPLVGESPLFQQIINVADSVARNDCVVLLEGESGTGKELIARRIHQNSLRNDGPFIPVNCPGISEGLFESQFYGHKKGSFTGANSDTLGIVRAAEGGTLMLDEVGELPLHLQPKLLRVLQEREVTPVGESRPVPVDTRFIAATNRSLAKSVSEGDFRSDLYHRLNIVRIVIPPLRNRPQDIMAVLDYYLEYYAIQYNKPVVQIGNNLRLQLQEYPWTGNARELCGYVERLYATDLPPMPPASQIWDDGYHAARPAPIGAPGRMPLQESEAPIVSYTSLADVETLAIKRALKIANNNRTTAARLLDIHRSTLIRKIRLLRIDNL